MKLVSLTFILYEKFNKEYRGKTYLSLTRELTVTVPLEYLEDKFDVEPREKDPYLHLTRDEFDAIETNLDEIMEDHNLTLPHHDHMIFVGLEVTDSPTEVEACSFGYEMGK